MSACCGTTKQVTTNLAPPDPAKHVNYVRGMVLGVDEFTQEFAYLSGRDRMLAREAIGYGTLRGLALRWETDKGAILPKVMVTAGTALSPCGQLICVSADQCADINLWLAGRTDEISAKFDAGANSGTLNLNVTLAYADCLTDDAPIPGESCRSAVELMQPARVTDSFALELSYEGDAPLQAEEDALRGFSSWLRAISGTTTNLALDEFLAKVRAWKDESNPDPTTITVSAKDRRIYFAAAWRIWVTELRAGVERAGAHTRFDGWVHAAPQSSTGTITKAEFLAAVRVWTPRAWAWPASLLIKDSDKSDFVASALALWDSEIAPKWYGEACGCRAPASPGCADDRVLIGTLTFNVSKTAGNPWMVVIPEPASDKSPSVDDSRRPIVPSLRALSSRIDAL